MSPPTQASAPFAFFPSLHLCTWLRFRGLSCHPPWPIFPNHNASRGECCTAPPLHPAPSRCPPRSTPSIHPGRPQRSQTSFGPSQGHRPATAVRITLPAVPPELKLPSARDTHPKVTGRRPVVKEAAVKQQDTVAKPPRRHRLYKATDPPDSGRAGSRWEAGQRRQLANQSRRSCLGAPAPRSDFHQSKGT